MRKPPPLRRGDRIGVIAPASAPREAAHLEAGIRRLQALGFEVETGRPNYEPLGFLSGTDEDRLAELNSMLRRSDLRAIFCVRGGYGSLRILTGVDYEAMRSAPRLLVGYSDITALHLAMLHRAGVPGIAGAMVASDFADPDEESLDHLWELASGADHVSLTGPLGGDLSPLREGEASGPLVGGNLTLITRLSGTPYLPDLTGAILVFEEIGEEPYRIDGLLSHLRLTGVMDRVAGVVVGAITEWQPKHDRPSLHLQEVLEHHLSRLSCPVATGLAFGHIRRKVSLPIGTRVRLRVDSVGGSLETLESVTQTDDVA